MRDAAFERYFAFVGGFFAEDDREERGFARAVRADQADAVLAIDLKRRIGEKNPSAVSFGDAGQELTSIVGESIVIATTGSNCFAVWCIDERTPVHHHALMKAAISRRRFLRTFPAGVGSGLLILPNARTAFAYEANNKLRVAGIGIGGPGR